MLDDLDSTLKKLLKQEMPQELVGEEASTKVSITFEPPDSGAITGPAIDLFLYDIRENLELRSNEWRLTRTENGKASREPPPVRVDCSYMVTAWPADSTDYEAEHRLLSAVMKVLLKYPKLPEEVLQGSLQDQEPPWRAFTARQSKLQSLGEYWQAMGGKPKAMLNYTITVSMPVHDAPAEIPLVMEVGGQSDGDG